MRIVIDLLDGPDAVDAAALAQLQALVRSAAAHDIRLALPDDPAASEALERVFAGLLPRTRLRPFALPGDARLAPLPPSLTTLLRRHALAGLAPDVVLVPRTPQPADDTLPTVVLDPEADAATLLTRLAATAAERVAPSTPGTRPRLAYVSPLPPERSGIADYSAALAPELARYYDVELVVDQAAAHDDDDDTRPRDARLDALPRRPVDWLRQHAHDYDRVLYHFGNAPMHRHMFDLIRDVPGVVVLHDFYFGNVIDHLDHQGYLAQGFVRALYESHGYTGLLGLRREGRTPAVWAWPVNRGILDHAAGIIVHGEYPRTLARQWYGADAAEGWRTIPLLRARPASRDANADADAGAGADTDVDARSEARARLGLGPGDFVVCSFGMLGPTKLNKELAAAFLASPLAQAPRCTLVFVGENDPGQYGAELAAAIRAAGAAGRIRITGFAAAATYADWLAACDAAVQLRRASRGETSAAMLDCLLHGVPTIVNAHGAAAALADDLVLKLPDLPDSAALTAAVAAALGRLHADAALRARLSRRAAAHMQAEHAPHHAGRQCFDAIEHFARHGEPAAYRALVEGAAALCPEDALPALAAAIAFNRPRPGQRQLLVDVSALLLDDLKTGIQRVVRSLLLALVAEPPPGYRVEPVFTPGVNRGYRYARQFGLALAGAAGPGASGGLALEDAPLDLHPGDIFFGLDLYLSGTAQNEQALRAMRARGVALHFCMYDVLPMLRPDAFPFGTEQHFGAFLRTVHRVADGVLCISRAVADELAGWIEAEGLAPQRAGRPLQLGWFHLGADIDGGAPARGPAPASPAAAAALAALAARPTFLMVGTVEPRKGHAQALAAFELLWAQGIDVNLVIVGKEGWMVEALMQRLRSHAERDQRLFWLGGVADEVLLALYAGASALLAASEGEGFGLPLIEAARHGIPIVARGLPVFREVAGDHAHYFEGHGAADLARTLANWLALWRAGKAPSSAGMPCLGWDASARQAMEAIVGGNWYRTI
ncbi:glycosyltransferase family 4 protein [Massilia phyllosphaerae]|uniref:glycosyltransferase family 4 protein n=1 Tax=Massilia phyllosphaerae TaxID=3106034 RepID=UPI002B1CCC5B|nr:glycosyltransferase family 1 protein [Massilia sp. SGZ-792]